MQNAMGSGVKSFASRAWRIVRWPILILVLAYIALVVLRIIDLQLEGKSAQAVSEIQAQHLTMNDVDGKHLPPPPDPSQVNATVAGVDANGNGIRDDVELAIFDKYPGASNEKIRAAELQYAMALQTELTQSVDKETFVAAVQQENRAFFCIGTVLTSEQTRVAASDVDALVVNTSARHQRYDDIYQKYMSSFGDNSNPQKCDLD